jgi:hypothetical protein
LAGIAAYAGLYQATYAYTQQRDARIQGIQLAIQVVQIIVTIVAGRGIAQASGLAGWMESVSGQGIGSGGNLIQPPDTAKGTLNVYPVDSKAPDAFPTSTFHVPCTSNSASHAVPGTRISMDILLAVE